MAEESRSPNYAICYDNVIAPCYIKLKDRFEKQGCKVTVLRQGWSDRFIAEFLVNREYLDAVDISFFPTEEDDGVECFMFSHKNGESIIHQKHSFHNYPEITTQFIDQRINFLLRSIGRKW